MSFLTFIVGIILGFVIAPESVANERVRKVIQALKPRAKPVILKPNTTDKEEAKITEIFGINE